MSTDVHTHIFYGYSVSIDAVLKQLLIKKANWHRVFGNGTEFIEWIRTGDAKNGISEIVIQPHTVTVPQFDINTGAKKPALVTKHPQRTLWYRNGHYTEDRAVFHYWVFGGTKYDDDFSSPTINDDDGDYGLKEVTWTDDRAAQWILNEVLPNAFKKGKSKVFAFMPYESDELVYLTSRPAFFVSEQGSGYDTISNHKKLPTAADLRRLAECARDVAQNYKLRFSDLRLVHLQYST